MHLNKPAGWLAAVAIVLTFHPGAYARQADSSAQQPGARNLVAVMPAHDTVLEPSDLQTILPATVFFKGQSAPLQMRNAGGVRFTDGAYQFAALVDTSGYSTGVQEKYQAYFVTEVALQFGEHRLSAGAYGVGFIAGNQFLVMDIGGHDLFTVASTHDEALRHPTPLRIVAAPEAGSYRLYAGRAFVSYTRAR